MSDNEDPGTRRSSRSRAKQSKNADVFEQIKQIRREGKVHRQNVDELVEDLYEEIDEDEYAEKYRADEFVVDDDGSGYVDNGQDDDEDPYYAANEKERKKKERRAGKVKKGALDNFFSAVIPSKKEAELVAPEKVDEDLNAMLAEVAESDILDDLAHEREPEEEFIPTPNKFKRNRPFSPDIAKFTPPSKVPRKHVKLTKRVQPTVVQKSSALPPPSSRFDDNNDCEFEFDSNDFDDAPSPPTTPQISKKEENILSKKFNRELSFEEEKPPETAQKTFETSKKNDISQIDFDESKLNFFEGEEESSPQTTVITDSDVSKTGYFQDTRSLRFYWFDAYEDAKNPGKVHLFGFIKKDGVFEFESCCVTIDKILHRVFFVKKDCNHETDEPVSDYMLYQEVNDLLINRYKVATFKSKSSIKRFAFMDGITPEEASCLEVCYDPCYPMLPPGPYDGKTFNRIANASVTAMERLLVEREIRGPCWLEITDVDEVHEKVSYCRREFKAVVSKVELDLVNIMPNMQHTPLPPCKMMALNIITVACPKTNKPHIVLITVLRSAAYYLDRRTSTKWDQKITYIAPPPGATFPIQFQQDIEKRKAQIEKCPNEKSMLQKFLGAVKMYDPDVVLGHDIAAQMSILRERLEDNKLVTVNWSFMGRLKRKENLKHAPQNKHFRWSWTAGRLYLDSKAAAMELVHSQSYDLDELVAKVLTPIEPNAKRLPIDTEMISRVFYENGGKTEPVFNLIQWSFYDAFFSHEILAQLNAMQLFLQITQIVGGVLSRTLLGGRAERNEYLLLHAFFRDGFVAPDRVTFKPKTKQVKPDANVINENGGEETQPQQQQPSSKKAQYTGGLVLEPKKGLYETFIVLLDFNSLYPSIIQEFNICFTTVKLEQTKEANESDLPPIPDSSIEAGILPKEIAKLVHTRRDIKNEMKRLNDKHCERYKQYDIRQLGLKLTANSMYGCLGFEGSRFCAKTLAAMITSKGREILESTRNLVESKGYSVIYGDTDSIMVNTNSINLAEAKQIGYTIKALINKSYKQLTLDIDGVYKRLLLLKKKKYAGLAIDLSNGLKVSKELKGLDIVRRDWSFLAREIGDKVVDIILQSNGRDEMVEEIRKTLSDVKEGIEQRTIPLEKFEILKKLTHRPEDYRDAKSQPHVLVALRLNQTRNANLRQNDIVKYIICDDGSGQAATQRAYARIEIETNSELKIDSSYYLAHQIHPVVSRLCEPIEEMDACQVAEALGLDGTHYRRRLIEQIDDDANDENSAPGIIFNFNACDGLPIQCPSCKHVDIHRSPILDDKRPSLAECSSCHYNLLSDPIKVELQIIDFLQKNCKKYSECKYVCDDVVCGFELDFPPVFKNEFGFPCTECSHGFFKPNYTLKRLFDQQNFVLKIVNFDEWESKEATKEQKEAINAYSKIVNYRFNSKDWTKRVSKFINENPYNCVDLSFVFAPMKIF